MIKYHLEPDFDKIKNSSDRYMRIEIPRVFWDGRKRDMPEPEHGLLKPSETFRERRKNRRMYLAGSTSSNTLANTYLDSYKWMILNVQSTLPGHPEDEMSEYNLSPRNRILQEMIESTEQKEEPRPETPLESPETPLESYQRRTPPYDGGRPAKRGKPGSYGDRRGRMGEPNLTITRIFRPTPSPGTSRQSALERIEPRASSLHSRSNSQRHKGESSSESLSDNEVESASSRKTSRKPEIANKSKSDEDDDEVMVLDPWDVSPANASPVSTSSDTEEDERAIQALVDKVAAKVRADYLKGKKERKNKRELEKKLKKKCV